MRNKFAAFAAVLALSCPAFATVTSTSSSASYTGNGSTTAYTVPFKFLANADLVVTVAGITQTLGSSYSVRGAGAATGTVTFASPPTSGAAVVITRAVPLTQTTSLRQSRSFDPATIENALDKRAMVEQQIANTHAADKATQATKDAAQDTSIAGVSNAVGALNSSSQAVTSASSVLAFGSTTPRTLTSRFGDVANVKDFNAKGDGATDDTAAFIAAAATGKVVLVPYSTSYYKLTGPVALTNGVIGDGSLPEIRMIGSDGSIAKRMFTITAYSGPGITISGLHLNGTWNGVATAGEFSHLVSVSGSSNVTVEGNFLENAYGDAVIAEANASVNSANVTVRGNRITNTYRCAVAVVAAFGVRVLHNTIVKSNSYVAVIDIEPNLDSATFVENVLVDGNTVSAPAAYFVNIYSPPTYPNTVRSIAVSHNRVQALYGVRKTDITGPMADISITDNEFLNHTGTSVECRGALIAHSPTNGTTLTGVVYARNIDRITMSNGGLTHGSSFSNVLGLVIANNVIDGARSTGIIVGSSPGAIITGNSIRSTLGVALDLIDYSGVAFNSLLVEGNYLGNEVLITSAPLSNAVFSGNVFSPPAGTTQLLISGTGATLSGGIMLGNLYLGTGIKVSGTHTNVINRDTGSTWGSVTIAAGGPFAVDAFLFEMWSGLANASTGAFTVAAPTNGYTGQSIDIRIRNGTGGALGAVTWDAIYKMATWVAPANGQGVIIRFRFDGTNWVEVARATGVPN